MGIALDAKLRFPHLPLWLGRELMLGGNTPKCNHLLRVITFPTKYDWRWKADISLIEESCVGLLEGMKMLDLPELYMPRPGCGYGGLDWADVKPILEKYLDDRFIVVEKNE